MVTQAASLYKRYSYLHTPDGKYRSPFFDFTRYLYSVWPSRVADPERVFELVESEINRQGGWEHYDVDQSPDEIWAEFQYVWQRLKFKIGETVLAVALSEAREMNPLPQDILDRYAKRDSFLHFMGMSAYAQIIRGDRPIFLPCETVGPLLGVSGRTVGHYCGIAESEGFLKKVAEHRWKAGRAAEYRFDVSRIEYFHSEKGKERVEELGALFAAVYESDEESGEEGEGHNNQQEGDV